MLDVADLSKKGNVHLYSWLLSLKKRGLVENIGVSIYESFELEGIDLDIVDVVQLPYSIYDQRMFKNGTLQKLFKKKIKIQARSVFLQGLLWLIKIVGRSDPTALSRASQSFYQRYRIVQFDSSSGKSYLRFFSTSP